MMDLFKKLQGLFGGDNSAESIEKQMKQMQEQMQAAFGGEETKRGWQPDEGVSAALGAYDGDDRMLKALYKVFDGWEALMKDGYKTLIKMRLDGLRGTPEEQAQLKKNNTILVRLIDNLNDASEEFLDAHGVGDYDYDDDDDED